MDKYEKVFEEDEYYNPTQSSNNGVGEVLGAIFGLVLNVTFKIVYYLVVYSPILAVSYWVKQKLKAEMSSISIVTFILTAYTLFCLIYFLKGLLIAFRKTGTWIWIVLFIFCVLLTSLLPALVAGIITFDFLQSIESTNFFLQVTGGVGVGIIIGWIIHRRYNLLMDNAPLPVYWAYSLGYKVRLFFRNI